MLTAIVHGIASRRNEHINMAIVDRTFDFSHGLLHQPSNGLSPDQPLYYRLPDISARIRQKHWSTASWVCPCHTKREVSRRKCISKCHVVQTLQSALCISHAISILLLLQSAMALTTLTARFFSSIVLQPSSPSSLSHSSGYAA